MEVALATAVAPASEVPAEFHNHFPATSAVASVYPLGSWHIVRLHSLDRLFCLFSWVGCRKLHGQPRIVHRILVQTCP